MTKRRKEKKHSADLVSPVHPVAVCECHGGLSSAVYFPPLGYIQYLPSQTANTLPFVHSSVHVPARAI